VVFVLAGKITAEDEGASDVAAIHVVRPGCTD
jgi:hypothetical protein